MCFVLRLIPKPFPSGKQSCTRSFLRSFPQDICCHHAVAQVGSKEEKALLRVGAATVVSTTIGFKASSLGFRASAPCLGTIDHGFRATWHVSKS